MTKELKRCPFCGSPAEYTSIDQEFVRCSAGLKCSSEAQVYTVEDWNSRPLEDALRNALEKIAKICNDSGFVSTDAKFKSIEKIVKDILID